MSKDKSLATIGEIIGESVCKKIMQTISRPRNANEFVQKTKARIRAYPQLKRNILRYKLDIENYQHESLGKSKSIVIMQPSYSKPLTVEDKRAAAIALVEKKLECDQREVDYIELALEEINKDKYYAAFEEYFFENHSFDEIAARVYKHRSVISRGVGRLVDRLTVFFYGAEAFAK